MDTNLKTLFFLCQAVGKHMIARGSGKIINIASMLTFQGGIRVPSYTASKSGVGGLTKLLANEWAAKRSEEHTSELQSLMRNSYAVFCLKKKKQKTDI